MIASLSVPHLTIFDEVEATKLMAMQKQLKAEAGKLTLTAMTVKAVSLALAKMPIINSKYNPNAAKPEYTIYASHNISLAIDTPDHGLMVPNIKNVQNLSLGEIQSELVRLQDAATRGRLSRDDITGGTFTISNVGVVGGTYIQAILFDGQAGILALGRIKTEWRGEDAPMKTKVMNISCAGDHRHLDGATVARFTTILRRYLENPQLMMLDMK